METNYFPIGIDSEIELFQQRLKDLKNGKGSVIAIEGESGAGKSFLMTEMMKIARKDESIISLMLENESPIGNFNVGNLQQLKPFSSAMDSLLEGNYKSAKDRFKKRLGISILASLPITGEIFYAVKEISKDWKDYKKESSKEKTDDKLSAIDEFYNAFCSFAYKSPLVLIIDDMQWADASSIEMIRRFANGDQPILFIFSYRRSDFSDPSIPLFPLIVTENNDIKRIRLKNLDSKEIEIYFRANLSNYKENEEFVSWVMEKSFGNPGILNEYLHYFEKHPPFNESGELTINLNDVHMPVTASAALAENINDLSDSDKNLLAICSAEGREFSAYMMSKLLNTDVVDVIQRMRTISQKSSVVRSLGANIRYGVKTTIYQFTQAFYYEYFHSGLEYEEKIALHGIVSKELKELYDYADEDEKEQIAPYLAAHSKEAENDELAERMTQISNENSQKYTPQELVDSDGNGNGKGSGSTETGEDSNISGTVVVGNISDNFDFVFARNEVLDDIFATRYESAISKAENIYYTNTNRLRLIEKVQLLSIIAKSYISINDFATAENKINEATQLLKEKPNAQAECFILNTTALLDAEQGRTVQALEKLRLAARMSLKLPVELKLLTITNISKIVEQQDPEMSASYKKAAIALADKLNFADFKNVIG
ncbi:MAG: BREX system ATP-binding domain-containing protein [Candidatus Kapaibacterium sp.]